MHAGNGMPACKSARLGDNDLPPVERLRRLAWLQRDAPAANRAHSNRHPTSPKRGKIQLASALMFAEDRHFNYNARTGS
jgi:hypothetical protein